MELPISVYSPNLRKRTDRKLLLEQQFWGKDEFSLTIVPAIEHKNGAWGLWQTFYSIVQREYTRKSPFFIFCEDDHQFTTEYSFDLLKSCILEADKLGADILSGGMSWTGNPVQISAHLFKVSAFCGMQFTVIFNRFYQHILSYETTEGYITDLHLSNISENIFVIYPFISIQAELGYSDVTMGNNRQGRVSTLFTNSYKKLNLLNKVRIFYDSLKERKPSGVADLSNTVLPTYIIHIPERQERRKNIEKQFSGRTEFNLHWVNACRHPKGAVGLWHSICKIIKEAKRTDKEVILICEDDHFFTPHYDKNNFLQQVWTAGNMGTHILLGGIGGFGNIIPIKDALYWTDWFWCTQFMVVYRRAFDRILCAEFSNSDVADEVLSRILPNKLIVYPFISEQKDFGYSDVTASNNRYGQIEEHFKNCKNKAEHYRKVALAYHIGENMLVDKREQQIKAYLKKHTIRGLHLGCGSNLLHDWLNADLYPTKGAIFLDATQLFPFPDNCFDFIFSEHMFEHLSYESGQKMLKECHRVLKKGGTLRLTMPDFEFLMRLYSDPQNELHQRYASWSLQTFAPKEFINFAAENSTIPMSLVINNFMRFWGHKMIYDWNLIYGTLTRIGFRNTTKQQSGKSNHPFLCNVEKHAEIIPAWANKLESMTIETEK